MKTNTTWAKCFAIIPLVFLLSTNNFAAEVATAGPKATQKSLDAETAARIAADASLENKINELEAKVNELQALVDTLFPPPYSLGDIGPAGGFVFYVTNDGNNGLEAAPEDLAGTYVWGCYGRLVNGADATAIGTGAQNTSDIVANCVTSENTAAEAASTYSHNGFDDWFLPSRDELEALHAWNGPASIVNPGNFALATYWSSSEYSSLTAWDQYFNYGNPNKNDNKFTFRNVRPVRAF